ncbi:50S ribosomal protein L10, partial [Mycoplasmopsis synoviae]
MKESSLKLAKKVIVSVITNKISSAKAIAFAEYRGLTVAQLKEMRVEAKKVGVELKVYKNRLFKLATDKLGYDLSSF